MSYDGETFEVSEVFTAVFETVSEDRARWLKTTHLWRIAFEIISTKPACSPPSSKALKTNIPYC